MASLIMNLLRNRWELQQPPRATIRFWVICVTCIRALATLDLSRAEWTSTRGERKVSVRASGVEPPHRSERLETLRISA